MYIEQGYRGELGLWKYLIIPGCFFTLMFLNYLVIVFFNINVEAVINAEISRKGPDRFFIETMMPFVIGLGGLFLWVKYLHRQSISSLTTSRKKIDWKRILFSFVLWALIIIVTTTLDIVLSPQDYVFNFTLWPFVKLLVLAVLLIPVQTSFEEYLFRGYIMQGLGIWSRNNWLPLIFTSIVFGLMHIGNPEIENLGYSLLIYYIGTGFFLGILTLMDKGLELALGFHVANNLIGALLVTQEGTAFQVEALFRRTSETSLITDALIPVFVIFPILLFIYAKKYKWTNWKERLTGRVLEKEEFLAQENNL